MTVAWKLGTLRGPQLSEAGVDVLRSAQLLEDWDQVQQLGVCHVIKPRLHRHCILRVEDVRSRRVVQDEGFSQVPPQAAEVLDITALVEHAGLTEQASPEHPTPVQQVRHRVSILGQAGSEENAFKEFPHPSQELIHVRPLEHIYLVSGPLDLYRHYEVGIVDWLKRTMHKGFIQVNDHADPSLIFFCHLWEQAGPRDLIKLVLETLEQIRLSNGVGFLLVRGELSGGVRLANILGVETAEKGLEDVTSTRLFKRGLGDQA